MSRNGIPCFKGLSASLEASPAGSRAHRWHGEILSGNRASRHKFQLINDMVSAYAGDIADFERVRRAGWPFLIRLKFDGHEARSSRIDT